MKFSSRSVLLLLALVGSSTDAFRFLPVPLSSGSVRQRVENAIRLSMSSNDYLSALSSSSNPPQPPQLTPAPPQEGYASEATYTPPAFQLSPDMPSGGEDLTYMPREFPLAKAGPFDSMTPKTHVVQGGQQAEFQAPSDPHAATAFRFPHVTSNQELEGLLQQHKAGPFDTITPSDAVVQGGQLPEFQNPANQAAPAVRSYLDALAKTGPFDTMTPKGDTVVQGGQMSEFQDPAHQAGHAASTSRYQSVDPRSAGPKAGPFDTMTPKASVMQGGQTSEFRSPNEEASHEVGLEYPQSKAGPFDTMTPKASVMQGGQTAEFQSPREEVAHEVGRYQNSMSKTGPFDTMTPNSSSGAMQGGQTAEFHTPANEMVHEVGRYHTNNFKAGPFDTMTPKDPVVQGGQIAEFKPPSLPEAATSVPFPHVSTSDESAAVGALVFPSSVDVAETVTADSESIVFSHAPISYFAIENLTPKGPRAGADVGAPHDSSRPFAQVDTSSLTSTSLSSGSWWCAAGGWPSPNLRPTTEVFMVFSGRGCVTDLDGTARHYFGPGDTVILPKGWSGRWDIHEDIHKVWFVHDHPDVDPSFAGVDIAPFNCVRNYQGGNMAEAMASPSLTFMGKNAVATESPGGPPILGTSNGAPLPIVGADPLDPFVRAVVVPYSQLNDLNRLQLDVTPAAFDASPSTASQTVYRVGSTTVGSSLLSPGSYMVAGQSRTECFYVLEGVFLLTNTDGSARRCVAGDTIVIPKGWNGRWDVLEQARTLKVVVV
ncbi:Enzyme of the cupin superfamily [Seminavis robusta]|uniref:Enzyme of the cupin superfamily n=1 Tax=Seminavis robusta TaxID=568900 RepID=A0A9N8HLF0_9STRA|nr:Enzyme of the cupin superfamily [Seminavis robusta]|eukprot:Sro910_g219160.1 Enzyme of the cupin superfamily (766) ;mRNA; r:33703-36000